METPTNTNQVLTTKQTIDGETKKRKPLIDLKRYFPYIVGAFILGVLVFEYIQIDLSMHNKAEAPKSVDATQLLRQEEKSVLLQLNSSSVSVDAKSALRRDMTLKSPQVINPSAVDSIAVLTDTMSSDKMKSQSYNNNSTAIRRK